MSLRKRLKEHIQNNRWQYLVIGLVFIIGLVMGSQKVDGLEGGVRDHLGQMIDHYLQEGRTVPHYGPGIFLAALTTQAKTVLAIWFLGLTVIGVPLILAVIFLRGYALGFTLGFLVQEKGGAGIVMILLTVVPQNLVYVPLLLMWAVIAVNLSAFLVSRTPGFSLGKVLLNYCAMMTVFLLIFVAGAFIEAYLSPWFLSLLL